MDWGLLFGGSAFGLSLVGTTSGFVYLIMRLITNPLKEDLEEMKKTVGQMNDKMKGPEDLDNLIQRHIAEHSANCKKGT